MRHLKDGTLKATIEQHRNKTLNVYKADPQRIARDTRAAERATGDHVGRWLFELLQNSDDARATEVLVLVKDDTVYVADNGHGFKPESVSAICGTDFSDKTAGTIGRKGVGFKSVYEVSRNPQVLTVDGEGIEFSPDKTKAWLHDNGLDGKSVPYQWIPFFISWGDAQARDPHLDDFKAKGFKTVVRLPGVSQKKKTEVEQLLKEWPPHALFAFRHLRKITAPDLEVVLSTGDGAWSLRDSRGLTPDKWQVARHTEFPPENLLGELGENERNFVSKEGVGFLIAAPLKGNCAVPTTDYLPVHVFYPTEQEGPVRLILHAEFLVKSDRTALMPVDGNTFNAWVAYRLAYHVCKFVNDSYRPESPSSHAALLVPFKDRASHQVANALWQRMAKKAQNDLRLADVGGQQRLSLCEAKLLSVSVSSDLARTLLEATSVRGQLLHRSFDTDKEARNALRELGCKEIRDQDLMTAIAQNAASLAANPEWVWACWAWLAAWVAEKPYYDEEHKKRIAQVKALPVIPVGDTLLRCSDLAGRIVTLKPNAGVGDLPQWLPLTFVEDWFRDRLQKESKEKSTIKKLSEELEIKEPGADVIQRAVGLAIEQYWKDKQDDPGRFLRFILEQDWHQTVEALPQLRRCPVPVKGETWEEAQKAYFGTGWNNDLNERLYEGQHGIAWVQRVGGDAERERAILEWLGCVPSPRIVEDRGPKRAGIDAYTLPDECRAWRTQEFGHTDWRTPTVEAISRLEAVTIEKLNDAQVCALLALIARHWEDYYKARSQTQLRWFYYTDRWCNVRAFWWFQILHMVRPKMRRGSAPTALADCWLPDKRTEQAIGDLLPVIDLDAFENDKDAVRNWLVSAACLRSRMEQLTVQEWKKLLSTRIPGKAPAKRLTSDERLRDRVTKWYEACLETVAENEQIPQGVFTSCPLLCTRAGSWEYVNAEPRYLNDDNELATAFAADFWLFHIPTRLAAHAEKYFGILPLSRHVRVEAMPGEPKSPLTGELLSRLNNSVPYLWAWRSSQSKQDAESSSGRLKGLKVYVVPELKVKLELAGIRCEVERRWHVEGDTIYLHTDHQNEAELAIALAKALDVRSEADFYENLLRCADERQRKEKLLSKGIADAEIERCIREYSQQPAEVEDGTRSEGPTTNLQQPPDTLPPGPHGDQPRAIKQPQSPGGTSPTTQKTLKPEDQQPLDLKDPRTVVYVLGGRSGVGGGHGGGAGDGGTGQGDRLLTDAEKGALEKAGRIIVTRELQNSGYVVQTMPQGNPGFDLRATKDKEELRVEVKAHSGRATVVEITQREYKEYLTQQGYRWELWNVEHLAESDASPVRITRYETIPDDALDVRTFRGRPEEVLIDFIAKLQKKRIANASSRGPCRRSRSYDQKLWIVTRQ